MTGRSSAVAVAALTVIVCAFAVGIVGNPIVDAPKAVFGWALVGFPAVGALIVARLPRHRIGRLLLGVGAAFGLAVALQAVALERGSGLVGVASDGLWKIAFVLIGLTILLFPTGRLPGRRWRLLGLALPVLGALAVVSGAVLPGPTAAPTGPPNPLAVPALAPVAAVLAGGAGFLVLGLLLLGCVASVLARLRRAEGQERAQLLWFCLGGGVLVAVLLGDGLLQLAGAPSELPVYDVIEAAAYLGLAASIAVAILRHGLFDVDRLASRTLAYGGLAALATAAYVGLVLLAGLVLPPVVSPFLAAAAVAVAFHPVRVRLVRAADALVYGRRAQPYEVLAATTRRVADAVSDADALPLLARSLAAGVAGRASVWLHRDGRWTCAAAAPAPPGGDEPSGAVFPVRHAGELLGALAVERTRSLTPTEHRLALDLAAQAGIVVRNAALATELDERLRQLRGTAARLVAAQAAERRRLERDLHDGAQQQLTALAVKIGVARAVLPGEPVLDELAADVVTAIAQARELARGIAPPLLAAQGLRPALAARVRGAPLPVDLACPDARFAPDVEAALYFTCAEALQNVVKHAGARRASVTIRAGVDGVRLCVRDDGCGFDPATAAGGSGLAGMADRFTALGGTLRVCSAPGAGTTVSGSLPC